MRVTNRMITERQISYMSDNLEQLSSLQEKVSSMKKFQTASDDPVSASMSLNLRSSLRSIEDYSETVSQAADFMSANELAFQKMEDLALRSENLILRGLNDSLGPEERINSIAPEMVGLINEAIDGANAKHNGQFIFAGTQNNNLAPYGLDAAGNPAVTAPLSGTLQRSIGPGKTIGLNYHADDVFGSFFTALDSARDALQANDTTALRTSLGALQSAVNTISQYRTLNGTRMRQVEVAKDYLESTKLQTKNLLTHSEEINLAEGISLLKNQETTYQVVLEVSQRAVSTMNLFDFLS